MYSQIYRYGIYPLYHALKNDGFNRAFAQSRHIESLAPDALVQYQALRLVELLRHAYRHVRFYRNEFIRHGIMTADAVQAEHLAVLPLMTKADITKNFQDLQSSSRLAAFVRENSTSGSSGEPFRFKTDALSYAKRAALVDRNHRWVGVQHGEREVRLWGAQMDLSRVNNFRGKCHSLVTRQLQLSTYDMTEQRLAEYAEAINWFSPALITSYPGPMTVFAEYCAARQIRFPALRGIITSAEMLYPHQREIIENALGVKVFNRYGSREFGDIAQEDCDHDGLRVNSDHVYVEILDESGQPCPPGVQGELYLTDLDNYCMPFIRYKICDQAAWAVQQNTRTGMPFPKITQIEGRSLDVITGLNGNRLGGTFWTILLRSRYQFEQFRVRQVTNDTLEILYTGARTLLGENDYEYYRQEIRKKLGSGMRVEFIKLDKFDLAINGKHKLIESVL